MLPLVLGALMLSGHMLLHPLQRLSDATGGLIDSVTFVVTNSTKFAFALLGDAREEKGNQPG